MATDAQSGLTSADLVPRTLTVLAAIRPGEEQALRDVLRPIGDDIRGKRLAATPDRPRIDFVRSRRIHFARFAILTDPDRGLGRQRLLYSANFDGDLDGHLAELIAITSSMEAIWGRCEGYTGSEGFPAFIRARRHEPEAFYVAFREDSVERILGAIALRQEVRTLVDTSADPLAAILSRFSPARPAWAGDIRRLLDTAGRIIGEALERLIRALPIGADVVKAIARCGLGNVVRGTLRIVASLARYTLFRWVNGLTGNRLAPRHSVYSGVPLDNCVLAPLVSGDETPTGPDHPVPPTFREDVVTQNQLTLVTVVKPGQADRVRAVMAAIDSYAKRLSPAGSLIGISTIHFVKWLVIDDGRRLMMVSDYDGSWESYIDEFAEMILSGLDAIWETSHGYPIDGARDLPAFKRFLRNHQVPSEVFFSAYPDETILNVVNNRALARACAGAEVNPLRALLQRM